MVRTRCRRRFGTVKSRSTTSSSVRLAECSFLVIVRTHPLSHYVVVGQEELDSRSVNVRNRDDVGTKARTETLPLDVIAEKLAGLKETRSLHNKLV